MSIERNTAHQIARCIWKNILSGSSRSKERRFERYERYVGCQRETSSFHANKVWHGLSVLEEGLSWCEDGHEILDDTEADEHDLHMTKKVKNGNNMWVELNYERILYVFHLQFGLVEVTTERQVDEVLGALADLAVLSVL